MDQGMNDRGEKTMMKSITVDRRDIPGAEADVLFNIIRRWFSDRSSIEAAEGDSGEFVLKLRLNGDIPGESFQTARESEKCVVIEAGCIRGIYAGTGLFLRECRIAEDGFDPCCTEGLSTPRKEVRGMYFATHFYNFYHSAEIGKIERYVEDISLWGLNSIVVWFDMHHYKSMEDPMAMEMIRRLRLILTAVKKVGMGACLGILSNEGFSESPPELKADWTSGHDGYFAEPVGHYHVELCPSKPEGLALILKNREDMLKQLSDMDFEYIWLWPYDQGGCTCSECAPWGANGFLMTTVELAKLTGKYFPKSKLILSCWDFDEFIHGEWDAFKKTFSNEPKWIDYLLVEPRSKYTSFPVRKGELFGLDMVGFPEISMMFATPWGGFGANPLPTFLKDIWSVSGNELEGGFPYSEGIFEDMNKYMVSRMYWTGGSDTGAALKEYLSAYVSRDLADELLHAMLLLERGMARTRVEADGTRRSYPDPSEYDGKGVRYVIEDTTGIDEAHDIILGCDVKISERIRQSWRWRIILLRAVIDHELFHNGFLPNQRCMDSYRELIDIYSASDADWAVRPPVTR
jgi:hypothetical protein